MSRLVPVLLLSVTTGCDAFSVDLNLETDYDPTVPMEFELGVLGTDCNDPTTRVDTETGWTEYSTTDDAGTCNIHAEGEMLFLDMAEVQAKVEQAIIDEGQDPDKVDIEITGVTVRFTDIRLVDVNGSDIMPPLLSSWSSTLELGGSPFVSFSGTDTNTLLQSATDVDLGDAQVAMLNDAYQDGSPVSTGGVADVAMDTFDAYQAVFAAADGPRVAFTFGVTLHATATRHLL